MDDRDKGHRERVLPFIGTPHVFNELAYSPRWNTSSKTRYSGTYEPDGLQGSQVTDSENHPGWWRASANGPDVGGSFYTQKRYATGFVPRQQFQGDRYLPGPELGMYWDYDGPVYPLSFSGTQFPFPPAFPSSKGTLDSEGASAIALTKPTNSLATLATSLLELAHEGLPKLLGAKSWESRTVRAKVAADEYLNYEFGFKPLVGEIKSVMASIAQADTLIKQYERDAGRPVRRRFNFPPVVQYEFQTYDMSNIGAYVPVQSSLMYEPVLPSGMTVVRTRKRSTTRWFSGCYTYALPDADSVFGRMKAYSLEAKKLLGFTITPEVIWNFMPWTWAVDWFSNIGDVVSTLSDMSTDGLVVKYGYLMEHTFCEDSYAWHGPTGLVDPTVVPSMINLVTETKIRHRASPYGFGLTWEGLTNRQQAIMAALGLSRSRY